MLPLEAQSVRHEHVLGQIEEWAAKGPRSIAVECEGTQLTYAELIAKSEHVAAHLRNEGISRGDLVAVCLNRSIELVVAIIGILKAGAAYLPIDPFIPEKRLEFMLQDAGALLVITENAFLPRLAGWHRALVKDLLKPSSDSLGDFPAVGPDDLAYVIYTSGSTGRPKGVEILHRGLVLCLQSVRQELATSPDDTVLSVTSPSFDVFVMEMMVALNSGARLVLLPHQRMMLREVLEGAIAYYDPTILFGTPPLWRLLLDGGWKGSQKLRAITGGEALDSRLAAGMLERCASLWNHYGPTEVTIVASSCRVSAADLPSPIGNPLPHIRSFVVDSKGKPVEPGTPGELWIGGESLGRGYRNHPELTSSRFINAEVEPGVIERVYRTGDLVRQRADGALEFAGRIDNQVKIRGFRVELEEIESALNEHPDVLESAVVVLENSPDEKVLAAYYHLIAGRLAPADSLRSFLAARLPPYMVPSHLIEVESLPLTINGKLDRAQLARRRVEPRVEASPAFAEQVPIEAQLLAIWRRVFRLPSLRADDNFFDLGGHSLLAARLFEEIERRLRRELPLSCLFEAPTVASLAKMIATPVDAEAAWSPLVKISGGTGTPFFCVHPIGGNVLTFKNLAAHMNGRPFYGLQARGLSRRESPHTSIDEMAIDYLAYVRAVQPSGPYFLGGYSAGGLVAFEMARLLQESGERVELIVLFDSYLHSQSLPHPPESTARYPSGLRRSFGAVGRRVFQMRHTAPGKRFGIIARDLARIWSTLKLKTYEKASRWHWNPVRLDPVSAFLFAIRNYRPTPLAARVTLFLANVNAPAPAKHLPAVWRELVIGELHVHQLGTDHDRLLEAPFAAELANTIERQISALSDGEVRPGMRVSHSL